MDNYQEDKLVTVLATISVIIILSMAIYLNEVLFVICAFPYWLIAFVSSKLPVMVMTYRDTRHRQRLYKKYQKNIKERNMSIDEIRRIIK